MAKPLATLDIMTGLFSTLQKTQIIPRHLSYIAKNSPAIIAIFFWWIDYSIVYLLTIIQDFPLTCKEKMCLYKKIFNDCNAQ